MAEQAELDRWLRKLGSELDKKQRPLRGYQDYYDGKHNLVFATEKFKSAFGRLFEAFADNFTAVVVDSTEERMKVQGFRFPPSDDQAKADETGDKDAWRIWQANNLDADAQLAHTEQLVKSECSLLVWNDPNDEKTPSITVESALEMVVARAAGNRRKRLAAMKRWVDDSGYIFATLYLPDGIYKFRSRSKSTNSTAVNYQGIRWVPRESEITGDDAWPLANPLGVVPVIPMTNQTRLDGSGNSEIENIIPMQDAINKLGTDMLVASEFVAWPQRYIMGIELPKDPLTGQPIDSVKVGFDRLFTTKNKDARAGEFSAADFSNHIKAIEMYMNHMASTSRTPPHYFLAGMGTFPTGEAIASSESGLVAKVVRRCTHAGEAWEDALRLAFAVLDDPRKDAFTAETIWGDPSYRSEAEHIDALLKQKAMGVPDEILWEKAGYSPTEIDRIKQIRMQEALTLGNAFDPLGELPNPADAA
jgi:hypothetical protein